MQITIRSDGTLEKFTANLNRLPEWLPAIVRQNFIPLRASAIDRMREAIAANRYTGALEQSLQGKFSDNGWTLTINPTVMRGKYDGGAILELGTKPIPNCPWLPIKAWAEFRGVPAYPVWMKIRTKGVSAHPYLQRTLDKLLPFIQEIARRIVMDMAESVVSGRGTKSI